MKILIVGENINSVLLAKYINIQNPEYEIYITENENEKYKFCKSVNVKESDVQGLVSFVKHNQIEFTVVMSGIAVINGITDEFQKEGFSIFAPASQSARVTFFNSIAKKILYKLKISTPRFGIFDRENLAVDYVRNIKMPVVIENDFMLIERTSEKYNSFPKAKIGIQKIFETINEKIVIENYIEGEVVYLYFITDGYSAFPLVNIVRNEYKNYISLLSSCSKLSENMLVKILQSVVYPLLDDIAKFSQPYVGILGMKIKINKNLFQVYEFYNTFQSYDFQTFLSILNENVIHLMYDTANGSLADNRDYVNTADDFSYSLVIKKEYIKADVTDDENLFITEDDGYVVYTLLKKTVNRAKEELLELLDSAADKVVTDEIKSNETEKEIRI